MVDAKGRLIPSVVAYPITADKAEAIERKSLGDQDELLLAMMQAPNSSLSRWAEYLGWHHKNGVPNKQRVSRALDALKADKLVVKRRGCWTLTADGKKEAEKLGWTPK